MKASLIGQPLNESLVLAYRAGIIHFFSVNPGRHEVDDISDAVICGKFSTWPEFARAIVGLESEREITSAFLGTKLFYQLVSTADEAQGSTSRSVAGENVTCGVEKTSVVRDDSASVKERSPAGNYPGIGDTRHKGATSQQKEILDTPSCHQNRAAGNQSSIPGPIHVTPSRPSLLRKANEIEYCNDGCGLIATDTCECGNPVSSLHRYGTDGHHDPAGMCGVCYDESIISGARA